MNRTQALRVLSGDNRSPVAAAMRAGLCALTPGYHAVVQLRNQAFDRGRKPVALGRPTISVGNITTGGTGKTPMVIELCRRLQAMGQRPAVLLRGYKGMRVRIDPAYDGPPPPRFDSDEAVIYADYLGDDVPIAADPDRVRSARYVLHHFPVVTCLLLDDAFQHRKVKRDLDLVLIDGTNPWGFGHLLPRGLLREPRENLRRADGVIITRADQSPGIVLDTEVRTVSGKPPVAHAQHVWAGYMNRQEQRPLDALAPMAVVAVSGIGNPEAFEQMVSRHAKVLLHAERRDDHHAWSAGEIMNLLNDAKRRGADGVVTTEKDYVKWRPLLPAKGPPLPILRPVLGIRFLDGSDAVDTLLGSVFTNTRKT